MTSPKSSILTNLNSATYSLGENQQQQTFRVKIHLTILGGFGGRRRLADAGRVDARDAELVLDAFAQTVGAEASARDAVVKNLR